MLIFIKKSSIEHYLAKRQNCTGQNIKFSLHLGSTIGFAVGENKVTGYESCNSKEIPLLEHSGLDISMSYVVSIEMPSNSTHLYTKHVTICEKIEIHQTSLLYSKSSSYKCCKRCCFLIMYCKNNSFTTVLIFRFTLQCDISDDAESYI